MERKDFSVAAALSIITGKMLCNFSEMHELAEWLMGHPIWTHEFAEKDLSDRLRNAAASQFPSLGECASADDVNGENYQQWLDVEVKRIGIGRLCFTKGEVQRTESPLSSLARVAPGKPVIAVVPPATA